MANTYELIGSATVGSGGAPSITFSSISGVYTDLILKASLRASSTGGGDDLALISFNGNTSNFSARWVYGNGSSAASGNSTTALARLVSWIDDSGYTASTFGNLEIYIPNYAGSSNKSFSTDGVAETNGTAGIDVMTAGLWSNTAAITSVSLAPYSGGNLAQYSTAYLYGVKNA
jgi:hypothetical protein